MQLTKHSIYIIENLLKLKNGPIDKYRTIFEKQNT